MIKLDNIRLQRGTKVLLENASATLNPGHKAALIGANGSGKSSVFKMLLGELSADEGDLDIASSLRISHMAQEVAISSRSAIDHVIDGDQQLRNLEAELAQAEQQNLYDRIAQLHEQLDNIDGYNARNRAEQLLLGLGFSLADTERAANSFSGGWRIRLNLAQALMMPSDVLLLDEPTNHLDLDAELWLEQWLNRYPGSLLLISHDREFIDSVCGEIIHLERQQLNSYRGNYSAFERQRAARLAEQQASFEKQQRRKQDIQQFVSRFRAKATKAKQAQSRLKELARMEEIAPAHVESPFDFTFPHPEKFSDPLLNLQQCALGYESSTILQGVNLSIHPGTRLGLLGANGAGKSTLIKTLAGELKTLQGERVCGSNLKLGYFSQHQLEALDINASPLLHLQRITPKATEQEIRNFLGGFNFYGDMALDAIEHFSGGEKARLALAIIVWQKPNLLLLDEPTNHLDLEMCHALTVALQTFEGAVIVVSHDRHLLRNTVDQFLLVANGKANTFDGDLEDYSRWLLTQKNQPSSSTTFDNTLTSAEAITEKSPASKKEQRQQAAEIRKKLTPLTKEIKKAEQLIAKLDKQLSAIEEQLSDSELYNAENKQQLQKLLQQQGELKSEKDQQEEHWLSLQEKLEELQTELSDG